MAEVIAILLGKESPHSLGISKECFESNYTKAVEMIIQGYTVHLVGGQYVIIAPRKLWERRIRTGYPTTSWGR